MRKVFLICSIRGVSPETAAAQARYVGHLESQGYEVYFPPIHTDQSASGLAICRQNLRAIEACDEVHVFYRPDSQGTHFDMGMAFALGKRVVVASNVPYGPGKSYARMLVEWASE